MGEIVIEFSLGQVIQLSPVDASGQATVLGVGKAKNSDNKVRLFRVAAGFDRQGNPVNIRTVQIMPPAGEEWSPQNGDVMAMIDNAGGIYLAIGAKDKVPPSLLLNQGEKRIYSYDASGAVRALHKCKANGKHYIGNLTAGQDLRAQLDALCIALNTFSGTAAQSAITTGGSSASALASAIVTLMQALFTAVNNCQTALDAFLDSTE